MQVAVITGAAGGIGAALAAVAVRRGMRVVLADRDAAALQRVAQPFGDRALAVPTDVTDEASMQALAQAAYTHFGQVDLLFNNAGVLSTGHCWEIPAAKWEQAWQVNVNGIVNGLRAFVPRLLTADRPAHIINTASMGGFLPSSMMAPYSATKFAVVALTECLLTELATLNPKIQVSLLAPGPVKTEIFNREAPPQAATGFHQTMVDLLNENGLAPEAFAELVFTSVERGDYWIFPQPELLDSLLERRNQTIATRQSPLFTWSPETVED